MSVINKYLILGLIAVILILCVISGFLWLSSKTAIAERDRAETSYTVAVNANETILKSLHSAIEERATIERLYADYMKEREHIERKTREQLKRKEQEITELRKRNEDIDAYLSVPVPGKYLDWMRTHANSNQD